jgi:hypothetical protein
MSVNKFNPDYMQRYDMRCSDDLGCMKPDPNGKWYRVEDVRRAIMEIVEEYQEEITRLLAAKDFIRGINEPIREKEHQAGDWVNTNPWSPEEKSEEGE